MLRQGVVLLLFATLTCAAACGGNSEAQGVGGGRAASAGHGVVASSSSGAVATSTAAGGGASKLAASCSVDADCADPAGLWCVESSENSSAFHGGPAGGYCTKDCTASSECASGACLGGICLLGCARGTPHGGITDPLDPAKCKGRHDLMCTTVAGSDVCLPMCGVDEQCDGGRKCDPRFGVCVDTVSTGDPINSKCDPDSPERTCAGVCVSIGGGNAMCSQRCSFGGEDPIGESQDCGGVEKGLCAYVSGAGPGDDAFCTGACTTHQQCQQPNLMFCWDFLGRGASGHGFCANIASSCGKEGIPCTGANDWKGSVCTKCDDGKLRCLDPTYPPPGNVGGVGGAGGTSSAAGGGGAGGN